MHDWVREPPRVLLPAQRDDERERRPRRERPLPHHLRRVRARLPSRLSPRLPGARPCRPAAENPRPEPAPLLPDNPHPPRSGAAAVPQPATQDGGRAEAALGGLVSSTRSRIQVMVADIVKCFLAIIVCGFVLPVVFSFLWLAVLRYFAAALVRGRNDSPSMLRAFVFGPVPPAVASPGWIDQTPLSVHPRRRGRRCSGRTCPGSW